MKDQDFINKNLEVKRYQVNERVIRESIKNVYTLTNKQKFFISVKRKNQKGLYQEISKASEQDIQAYFRTQMKHIKSMLYRVIAPTKNYITQEQQAYLYGFMDLFKDLEELDKQLAKQNKESL